MADQTDLTIRSETGLMTPAITQLYEDLLTVIDKSPVEVNEDFALIKSKDGKQHIEPTRDFALKAVSLARLNYEPVGPPMVDVAGKEHYVNVRIRVFTDADDPGITEIGGCSTEETRKKSGARAYHDALAVATTRAMKRALEAKIGLPFVNMLIKAVFGSFERNGAGDQGGGGTGGQPDKVRASLKVIHQMLREGKKAARISEAVADDWWKRAQVTSTNYTQLKQVEDSVRSLTGSVPDSFDTQEHIREAHRG